MLNQQLTACCSLRQSQSCSRAAGEDKQSNMPVCMKEDGSVSSMWLTCNAASEAASLLSDLTFHGSLSLTCIGTL